AGAGGATGGAASASICAMRVRRSETDIRLGHRPRDHSHEGLNRLLAWPMTQSTRRPRRPGRRCWSGKEPLWDAQHALQGGRACPFGFRATSRRSTDRKSTRLNSSHRTISYAVFCLKKKKKNILKINIGLALLPVLI